MDQEHHHIQSLGFCCRFYNFIKFLPANALKILTSGRLMPSRLTHPRGIKAAQIQSSSNSNSKSGQGAAEPTPQLEGTAAMEAKLEPGNCGVPRRTCSDEQDNEFAEEEGELPNSNGAAKGPPKKMVSINENVETINTSKKKKGKKAKEEIVVDDSKPLKSILKVSSDLNDNHTHPVSLLSLANGA